MAIVRGQTIFETLGLPHIDYLPRRFSHQVDTGLIGKFAFPGRVEKEASRRTRCNGFRGELTVSAKVLNLLCERSVSNVTTPGNRKLQTAAQVSQCIDALLPGQVQKFHKDGSCYFCITKSAVAIDHGYFQVSCNDIKFEAPQAREKTSCKWNGIKPINGKSVPQQLCFIGEEADIETDVMAYEDGSLDELEKVGEDLLCARCTCNHFLRDACELDNEWRQATIGVNETLK